MYNPKLKNVNRSPNARQRTHCYSRSQSNSSRSIAHCICSWYRLVPCARSSRSGVVGHGLVNPVYVEGQPGVDAWRVGHCTVDAPRHNACLVPLVRGVVLATHERPSTVTLQNIHNIRLAQKQNERHLRCIACAPHIWMHEVLRGKYPKLKFVLWSLLRSEADMGGWC
jgi:hypothetical protein